MKTLLVTGYNNFDLGIFDEKDPKLLIIKAAIRQKLEVFAVDGLQWLVFGGNLGFEYWVLEIAMEMKQDYHFKFATIFPFKTHGQNWNESNQSKLELFKKTDFIQYAFDNYEHPKQFKDYYDFLTQNADAAFVFYDDENETKLKYTVDRFEKTDNFPLYYLRFDTLQDLADEMASE